MFWQKSDGEEQYKQWVETIIIRELKRIDVDENEEIKELKRRIYNLEQSNTQEIKELKSRLEEHITQANGLKRQLETVQEQTDNQKLDISKLSMFKTLSYSFFLSLTLIIILMIVYLISNETIANTIIVIICALMLFFLFSFMLFFLFSFMLFRNLPNEIDGINRDIKKFQAKQSQIEETIDNLNTPPMENIQNNLESSSSNNIVSK